jgi:hypothetical protein
MASQEPIFMKGGFQDHLFDIFSKYKSPFEVVTVFFIATLVVFLDKVPIEIRIQADSFLGRSFLLLLITSITMLFGWPLGIVSALAAALFIGAGGVHPITKTEGFAPDLSVRMVPDKKKWFIEEVLGENPLMIEDQTVRTFAVQDLNERNTGNVQNSSVTR